MTKTEIKIINDTYKEFKSRRDVRGKYDEDPSTYYSGESVRRNIEDHLMENQRDHISKAIIK
jgi:hypothetical protein